MRIEALFETKSAREGRALAVLSVILFLVGLTSIFYRQPTSWYDEEIHYVRSIQLADGDWFVKKDKTDETTYGGDISLSQNKFADRAFATKLFDPTKQAIDPNWISQYRDLAYTGQKVFRISVTAVSYFPLSYLPYTTVAWLNQFLQFDVALEFMLMKLAGFVTSFTLLILAVRFMPFAKISMLLLALIPPYFLTMASISADAYLFGIAPLFIALSLSLVEKIKSGAVLKRKDLLVFGLTGLGLTLAKLPAALLVGLTVPIILLGCYKKISKKQLIYLSCFLLGMAMITLLWLKLVSGIDTGKYFGVVSDKQEQLAFIKSQPFAFLKTLFAAISHYNFFDMQLGYADGQQFMNLPVLAELLFPIGLIGSLFFSGNTLKEDKTVKNLSGLLYAYQSLLFLGITILVFLALYMDFNPVGSDQIQGVQPRYFLPYWLLLFGFKTRNNISSTVSQLYLIILGLSPLAYYLLLVAWQW